jgi:CheY-like chemotaxis protein
MKVLLVDDNAQDLQHEIAELVERGYEIVAAANGGDALTLFEHHRPDVVLTDIFLPGLDGFALVSAIRQRMGAQWEPVIFLSGHHDDALQVRALEVGADSYFIKPVSAAVLDAKLRSLGRLIAIQRQAEERAQALERYRAIEEEERHIARHLIDRLVNTSKLNDPALHHWLLSANDFSGDIIAAARTPANVLHVLLADGTGHGLAASINVLPIAPPFYSMTEKGFAIDTIARELNAKVRQFLPRERFVAATLASIDFREGIIKLWNGGNPEAVLIDAAGHPAHVFSESEVPLGVMDDDEFNPVLESVKFSEGAQLVAFSDGLLEATGPSGVAFGHENIAAALLTATAPTRLIELQNRVAAHLNGASAHDDISLLLVDCRHAELPAIGPATGPSSSSSSLPSSPSPSQPVRVGDWAFALRLGMADLRRLDVVPVLLNLANQFEDARQLGGELFVILSEFFNNALDHGLLRLDSRLKLAPDGMGVYLDQRAERLLGLVQGEVEISVGHVHAARGPALSIRCRDSGPGFDHVGRFAALRTLDSDAAPSELPFGRGLSLALSLCDELRFNEAGNEVVAVLSLTPRDTGSH